MRTLDWLNHVTVGPEISQPLCAHNVLVLQAVTAPFAAIYVCPLKTPVCWLWHKQWQVRAHPCALGTRCCDRPMCAQCMGKLLHDKDVSVCSEVELGGLHWCGMVGLATALAGINNDATCIQFGQGHSVLAVLQMLMEGLGALNWQG